MDPLILDPVTWKPILQKPLIQGYSSFIWTERFREAGDFQFTTPYVDDIMGRLNIGDFLTLKDSPEMMRVESRLIKDTGKGSELTVSGRSIMSFLEFRTPMDNNRVTKDNVGNTIPSYPFVEDTDYPYKMAAFFISKAIGGKNEMTYANPTAFPPDQYEPEYSEDEIRPLLWAWAGEFYSPNTTRYPELLTPEEGGANTWLTNFKFDSQPNTYAHVVEALKHRNRGLVFTRPGYTYNTSPNPPFSPDDAYFLVVDPKDHTIEATPDYNRVVFDVNKGHLVDPSYLWSNKDYRNVAYVVHPGGVKAVAPYGQSTTVSGLSRRVLQVDASDLTADVWVYQGYETIDQALTVIGRKALYDHNKTILLDAKVSPNAPFDLGYPWFYFDLSGDYALGDYVTLRGEYDIDQTMQVTEYIRTEDAFGNETVYPTLTLAEKLL